jgi:hypothetical protein
MYDYYCENILGLERGREVFDSSGFIAKDKELYTGGALKPIVAVFY